MNATRPQVTRETGLLAALGTGLHQRRRSLAQLLRVTAFGDASTGTTDQSVAPARVLVALAVAVAAPAFFEPSNGPDAAHFH